MGRAPYDDPYIPRDYQGEIIQLLTDIWHNQAIMIKWMSKLHEETRKKN